MGLGEVTWVKESKSGSVMDDFIMGVVGLVMLYDLATVLCFKQRGRTTTLLSLFQPVKSALFSAEQDSTKHCGDCALLQSKGSYPGSSSTSQWRKSSFSLLYDEQQRTICHPHICGYMFWRHLIISGV